MSPDRIRSACRAALTIIVLAAIYELIARSGYFPPVLLPILPSVGISTGGKYPERAMSS